MDRISEKSIIYTSLDYASSLNSVVDAVARERRFLSTVEGYSIESTMSFLKHIIDNSLAQYILVINNEVKGWCDIIPMSIPEFSHVGVLGIGLLPEYRGKGCLK